MRLTVGVASTAQHGNVIDFIQCSCAPQRSSLEMLFAAQAQLPDSLVVREVSASEKRVPERSKKKISRSALEYAKKPHF